MTLGSHKERVSTPAGIQKGRYRKSKTDDDLKRILCNLVTKTENISKK